MPTQPFACIAMGTDNRRQITAVVVIGGMALDPGDEQRTVALRMRCPCAANRVAGHPVMGD